MHFNILLGLGLLAVDSALAAPRKTDKYSTVTEYKTQKIPRTLEDLETATATAKDHAKHSVIEAEAEAKAEAEDRGEHAIAALETSTVVVSVTDTKTKHVTKTSSVNATKTVTANVTETTVTTDVAFRVAVVSTTDTNTEWTTATASFNATAIVATNTAFLVGTSSTTETETATRTDVVFVTTTETELVTATETVYIVNAAFKTNNTSVTVIADPELKTNKSLAMNDHFPFPEHGHLDHYLDDLMALMSRKAAITKTALAADNDTPSVTKTKHTATEDSDPLATFNADENETTFEKESASTEGADPLATSWSSQGGDLEDDDDTATTSTETEAATTEETGSLATSDGTEDGAPVEDDTTTATTEADPLITSGFGKRDTDGSSLQFVGDSMTECGR